MNKRYCIVCEKPMRVKKGRGGSCRKMHEHCRPLYMQRKSKEHYARQKIKPPTCPEFRRKKVEQLRVTKSAILLAHLPVGRFEEEVNKILNQ